LLRFICIGNLARICPVLASKVGFQPVSGLFQVAPGNDVVTLEDRPRLVSANGHSHAEFERELIRERVRSGIAAARAQGKRIGRPPRPVDADRVRELRSLGWSWARIASELGAGLGTVHRAGQ